MTSLLMQRRELADEFGRSSTGFRHHVVEQNDLVSSSPPARRELDERAFLATSATWGTTRSRVANPRFICDIVDDEEYALREATSDMSSTEATSRSSGTANQKHFLSISLSTPIVPPISSTSASDGEPESEPPSDGVDASPG